MIKSFRNTSYIALSLILFLSIFTSCENNNVTAPDVSDIDVTINVVRTEKALASLDTLNTLKSLQELVAKDSSFYHIFFNNVLRVPLKRLDGEKREKFIKGFINDKRIKRINHEVDSLYSDFTSLEREFIDAFKYVKYYFPEKSIPTLYTFISEYSVQRFIFEISEKRDGLGIGLDMFMGEDYPYANYVNSNASFSNYLTRRYNKEHMVKKVLEVMVEDWLGGESGIRMLDKMLYNGKKLYILNQFLPYAKGEIIMEYTSEQLKWCEENESEMWAFFFDEDLFYSTDINKISKLVSPSPNSSGMPPEAPGRTANYMGFQIVKAYMKRNPKVTLQELISNDKSQEILEKSRYKPKRK